MVNYTGRPEVFIVDVDEDADSGGVHCTLYLYSVQNEGRMNRF